MANEDQIIKATQIIDDCRCRAPGQPCEATVSLHLADLERLFGEALSGTRDVGLEEAAKIVCNFCNEGFEVELTEEVYRHRLPGETPWAVCHASKIRERIGGTHQEQYIWRRTVLLRAKVAAATIRQRYFPIPDTECKQVLFPREILESDLYKLIVLVLEGREPDRE